MNDILLRDIDNARRTSRERLSDISSGAGDSRPPNALSRPVSPEEGSPTFAELYGRRFSLAVSHGRWHVATALIGEARQRLEELQQTDPMEESVYDVWWNCSRNNTAGILYEAGLHTVRDVEDALRHDRLIEIDGLGSKRVELISEVVGRIQRESSMKRA